MPKPNAELAWKAYDTAIEHGKLDMDSWATSSGRVFGQLAVSLDELQNECGTTACLAGWTVALAGHIIREREVMDRAFDGEFPAYEVHVLSSSFEDLGDVPNVAAKLLGIDLRQAAGLFWVEEEDVEHAITRIFGPRPTPAGEQQESTEVSA